MEEALRQFSVDAQAKLNNASLTMNTNPGGRSRTAFVAVIAASCLFALGGLRLKSELLSPMSMVNTAPSTKRNATGCTSNGTPRTTSTSVAAPHQDILWNLTDHTENLLFVEDICHSSQRWFYRTDSSKRQPKVLLRMFDKEVGETYESPYQKQYRFKRGTENSTQNCVDSPITDHLVMFSVYNEMLGEFYDRGLFHLWLLSRQHEWVKNAQLYIHVYMPLRRILDSHLLFTSPFRNHPLLDFTTLIDETPCTCLPRLIFLGYNTFRGRGNESGFTVVEPGRNPIPERVNFGGWEHRDFRNFLLRSMIDDNPHVQEDILSRRMQIFDKHSIPVSERRMWKIVGLAQRNGRRRWRNLDSTLKKSQTHLEEHGIILLEANVESKFSTPYEQLITHGALDALVGIHGAQMTEAIWMKPGSWVVELLPYIPEGIIWGLWTVATHEPTPLGWIFDNTDLNHVGYPLKRDSAPYCYNNTNDDDPLECWRAWRHPWSDRDFELDAVSLEQILKAVMVGEFNTCQDYRSSVGEEMVLYNVNCAAEVNGDVEPHHFYWDHETTNRTT